MIVLIVEDLSISLKPQYSANEILSYKTLHKLLSNLIQVIHFPLPNETVPCQPDESRLNPSSSSVVFPLPG